jgi:predicted transcriptional regulator of viral defense system
VYATSDLAVILEQPYPSRLTEMVRRLVREGVLTRLRRGLYVDQLYGYRPDIAGCRWVAPSYLSTETALDRHGLCQTGILAFTYVTIRLLGRREKAVRFADGHRFVYRHLARHLFFGYRPEAGLLVADPEKAVLDFLYFHYKGQLSVVAPQDIDFHKLHAPRYRRYVKAYRQAGFSKFAMQWLAERRDAA